MLRPFSACLALFFVFSTAFIYADEIPLASLIDKMKVQINSDTPPTSVSETQFSANIVVCDQNEQKILILKPGTDWDKPESIVWEWSAEQSPQIAPTHRSWFNAPDECKPARGTSHLLITASGGGVALIRLADKACLFYSHIDGNPHSIELLPDGNIVTVSSGGLFTLWAVPEGNDAINSETRLTPNPRGAQYSLRGGHGCVWDEKEQRLWVLGYDELVAYRYNFDKKNPALTRDITISVDGTPADGGHDLYPVPNQRAFFVTGVGVGVFDFKTRKITSLLPDTDSEIDGHGIKSISLSPEGHLLVQSPTEHWYSDRVPFFNRSLTPIGTRSGAKIYKARWWVEKWK